MPYASRWIGTESKNIDVVDEIKTLINEKVIRGFPLQIDKKARPVSQAEHTIFISEDGPIVLTERT